MIKQLADNLILTIDENITPEDIYISPVGCYGIVRRKQERNLNINSRLEEVLLNISSQMTPEEIENARVSKREDVLAIIHLMTTLLTLIWNLQKLYKSQTNLNKCQYLIWVNNPIQ